MSSTDDAPAAPLTELPAHVTLQILARLSARDLASLLPLPFVLALLGRDPF